MMKKEKTLTIFTPAYNRAHTIGRTYTSLCRQTCKDFEWLIIDDGSTDGTRALVLSWMCGGTNVHEVTVSCDRRGECVEGMCEAGFLIRYIYQDNQGMHGAHNTAYRHITTELNACIDSDDYMPDDAVAHIVNLWRRCGSDRVAGMIGLDASIDGNIIGSAFPEGLQTTTLRGYYERLGGAGDKKLVYRTDVIGRYPEYPVFEGEKYVGLAYKYHLADEDYPLLVSNDVWVVVEYQPDGSSYGMWKQYWNNPKGFAFFRKFDMVRTYSWKRKVMDNIHYVSHSIRGKNWHFLQESPCRGLTFVCLVPGVALYFINKWKVKHNRTFKAHE